MEDLISVIVPVYNRYEYLRETIEAILNQTYKNLEIILIDDGSSDYALNVIKEYEKIDPRIISLTQKNGGICETIKNGLLLSNGKYFTRCDSDDINDVHRYEKQLKYLKENNYDVIGCYINAFGSASEGQKTYLENCTNKPIRNQIDTDERFLLGQGLTGGTIFAKRDALLEVMPFRKDYSKIEDYYLSIMMYKAGKKIGMLEEKLLNYRVHDNNLSLSGDRELLEKHTYVSFKHMFSDKIRNSERVIIFRMKHDSYYLYSIIEKYFNDIKGRFSIIHEEDAEKFVINNINILRDFNKNIVFYGVNFREIANFLMKNCGYKLYNNIFMSGY